MNCPVCGASAHEVYATTSGFVVHRCRACAFRYIDPSDPARPADAQFRHDDSDIGAIRPEQPHIRRRVRDAMRWTRSRGTALDIGCGKGEVCLALAEQGFQCTGLDMKPKLIDHLRERFPHVRWLCADAGQLQRSGSRFDLVTLYHVLEHVDDPRAVLNDVAAVAAPGATIVLEVPDTGGLEARLKGRRWHYHKVDHVSYFREGHLRRLADDAGLHVLEVRGYQHFSYPQDVLWKDLAKGALARIGFRDVLCVFLRAP